MNILKTEFYSLKWQILLLHKFYLSLKTSLWFLKFYYFGKEKHGSIPLCVVHLLNLCVT